MYGTGRSCKERDRQTGVHFYPSDSASRLNKGEAAGRLLAAICDGLRRWVAQTAGWLALQLYTMPKSFIPGHAHRFTAVTKLVLLMFISGGACSFRAAADGNSWSWTGNASAYWSNPNNWSPVGVHKMVIRCFLIKTTTTTDPPSTI